MTDAAMITEAHGILRALGLAGPADDLDVRPLAGGASNENFLVTLAGAPSVLRLAAPRSLSERFGLDRWVGTEAHQRAAAAGIAPRLLGVALPSGHSVVEFVSGEVLDESSILQGSNLEDSVLALRAAHRLDGSRCGDFSALAEIERFIAIAREEGLVLPPDIDDLHGLAAEIDGVFERAGVPRVLCHNDVQLANLIRDGDGRLWVIDWEYAGRGNPYFDLAMIVNNAGLEDADATRVRVAYFGADRDADFARIELERFDSAMREGLWSVVAEPVLTTDWDFRAWADRFLEIARQMADRIRRDELVVRAEPAPDDRAVFERTYES